MTSSTYGTAELQGDASPTPPKSYRLSKVAKIALRAPPTEVDRRRRKLLYVSRSRVARGLPDHYARE